MPNSPYPTPPPDALPLLFPATRREDVQRRTLVMGVVNITPDSFSDGGRFFSPEAALAHARRLLEEGADLLDIGGQSTRPGSEPVSEEEELRRILPVLEALAAETDAPISVDTTRASVAHEAMKRGAKLLNDISGLRFEPDLARVAAETGATLILMHSRDTPRTMQQNTQYDDLIGEIAACLTAQAELARCMGVLPERIVVDPGIGFAKTAAQNLELLRRGREFLSLGYPILYGPSRKAFIGKILADLLPEERVEGTGAAVALAVAAGARIVRVHDVRAMVRVARVADAICGR